MLSIRERLALVPPEERRAYLATLDPERLRSFMHRDWWSIARPEQLPPWDEDWRWLMIQAGRFFGKSRAGSEATRERCNWLAARYEGAPFQWALVSRRLKDVRNTMCEGPSGLRAILPPSLLIGGSWERSFNRGAVELKLTNGAEIKGYSSEAPDDLTGSGLAGAWVDEIASLRDARVGRYEMGTFYHLDAALREGPDPRGILTGTPRNNRLVRELVADPKVLVVRGSTYENLANAPATYLEFVARYANTRLGRQELMGELLGDVGTLFARADLLDDDRLLDAPPDWPGSRRVRAWDLASSEPSDNYPDPDWTVGAKISMDPVRRLYCVEHIVRFRAKPGSRDDRIRETARADGLRFQDIEQYRGAAGKDMVASLGRHLKGVARVRGHVPSGSKVLRAGGDEGPPDERALEQADRLAGAVEQGRVFLVRGPWLDGLVDEMEEFPGGAHDDQVDALSLGFKVLGDRVPPANPQAGQAAGRVLTPARAGRR